MAAWTCGRGAGHARDRLLDPVNMGSEGQRDRAVGRKRVRPRHRVRRDALARGHSIGFPWASARCRSCRRRSCSTRFRRHEDPARCRLRLQGGPRRRPGRYGRQRRRRRRRDRRQGRRGRAMKAGIGSASIRCPTDSSWRRWSRSTRSATSSIRDGPHRSPARARRMAAAARRAHALARAARREGRRRAEHHPRRRRHERGADEGARRRRWRRWRTTATPARSTPSTRRGRRHHFALATGSVEPGTASISTIGKRRPGCRSHGAGRGAGGDDGHGASRLPVGLRPRPLTRHSEWAPAHSRSVVQGTGTPARCVGRWEARPSVRWCVRARF